MHWLTPKRCVLWTRGIKWNGAVFTLSRRLHTASFHWERKLSGITSDWIGRKNERKRIRDRNGVSEISSVESYQRIFIFFISLLYEMGPIRSSSGPPHEVVLGDYVAAVQGRRLRAARPVRLRHQVFHVYPCIYLYICIILVNFTCFGQNNWSATSRSERKWCVR